MTALNESCDLKVMGITSRGIFLATPDKRTIFLSFEKYRGPLTINIEAPIEVIERSAQVIESQLIIGDTAICLDTSNLWEPEPAPTNIVPLPNRLNMLQHFLNRANAVIPSEARNLFDDLGRGPGLTPSGDDVVIGYLLTLNRYVNIVETLHPEGTSLLNQKFIQESRSRTTTLSANLIECAAQGLADERLIRVIDCIFTGDKDDKALDELLSWGDSSGRNVLQGIELAVKSKTLNHE